MLIIKKYEEINSLLAEAKLEKAIEFSIELAKVIENDTQLTEVNLIKSRYKHLKKREQRGFITNEELTKETNQITHSLMLVANELRKNDSSKKTRKKRKTKPLTKADILRITKTAIITIDLEKIKQEFYELDNWGKKNITLRKLFIYTDHATIEITKDVFLFLEDIASITRSGLTIECAYTIHSLINNFYPYRDKKVSKKDLKYLIRKAARVGKLIVYDASMYLEELKVVAHGLSVLKWVYQEKKYSNLDFAKQQVMEVFEWLEESIEYPEKQTTQYAKELIAIFKEDLPVDGLTYPDIPDYILDLM